MGLEIELWGMERPEKGCVRTGTPRVVSQRDFTLVGWHGEVGKSPVC